MGNALAWIIRKTLNASWQQPQSLTGAFLAAFEQQLKPKADSKKRSAIPDPGLQVGNQPGGFQVLHRRVEGSDPRKNQGVRRRQICFGADVHHGTPKPFERSSDGMEVPHSVIDQADRQSLTPQPGWFQRYFEMVPLSVALGTAPTTVSTFWPPLNTIRVGMLRIPYWLATLGFSSVLSLNTLI